MQAGRQARRQTDKERHKDKQTGGKRQNNS